jgi:hypothetical protein
MDKHNSATRLSVVGLRFLAVIACGCSTNDDSSSQSVVPPASGGQPAVVVGSGGAVAPPPVATVSTTGGAGGVVVGAGGAGGMSSLGGAGGTPLGMGGTIAGGAGGALAPGGAGGQVGTGGTTSGIPDLVLHMKGTIDAGAEAMFCMLYQMPTDGKTAVPSAESHYTPGSHHFLIFRTSLTSITPGADVAHLCGTSNTTVAVSGGSNGLLAGESVQGSTGSYYEAQTPDAHRDLPPGVAHVFQPGEILNVTAHYLNTTDATIDSTIEFRMHRMNVSDVKQEAGTFFLLDTQLNIPPNSQVTATKACPITKDINLGLLWSHMHSRGYSFKATTDDAAAMAQLGGDVYDQPGPEGWAEPHVQTYPWDPPVTLHAGSKLTISCTYRNTTTRTFTFGQSAETAEMCLLHGMYWPRLDSATEQCSHGTSTTGTPGPITSGM